MVSWMLKKIARWRRRRLVSRPLSMRPDRGVLGVALSWVLLLMLVLVCLVLGGWAGYWWSMRERGENYVRQSHELAHLRAELGRQQEALRIKDQQLLVEQTTRAALSRELRDAQAEVQVRQQALDFYDHLLVSNDRGRPARFAACEWRALGDGRYRYRLLLAQGQSRAADFSGRVAVVVNYQHEKKAGRISTGEDSPLPVKFRHYQRLEGGMRLPDGALPQQLEARIFMDGGKQPVASCQKRIWGI